MTNKATTGLPTTTAQGGGSAPTGEDPHQEPLARFVDRVEKMREGLEGEPLARGVASALGALLKEKGWLLPEHRRGWTDRFRQLILHVAPDGGFSMVAVVWQPG